MSFSLSPYKSLKLINIKLLPLICKSLICTSLYENILEIPKKTLRKSHTRPSSKKRAIDRARKEWKGFKVFVESHYSKLPDAKSLWKSVMSYRREEFPNLCKLASLIVVGWLNVKFCCYRYWPEKSTKLFSDLLLVINFEFFIGVQHLITLKLFQGGVFVFVYIFLYKEKKMSKFSISAPQNESHQQKELQKGSKRRHFRLLYGKSIKINQTFRL